MALVVVGAAAASGLAGAALVDAIPPIEERVRSAARELIPDGYEIRDEQAGAPRTWFGAQAPYAAQIFADPGEASGGEQERALESRAQELGWEYTPNRLDALDFAKDGMKAFLIPVSGEVHVRVQRSSDRWSRLELGAVGAVGGAALAGVGAVIWALARRKHGAAANRSD